MAEDSVEAKCVIWKVLEDTVLLYGCLVWTSRGVMVDGRQAE